MEVLLRNTNQFRFEHSHVGDICSGLFICQMGNGVEVVVVVVYILINQEMIDIKEFILRALLEYSKDGAEIFKEFGRNYDKMPMILAGDFNTDFQKEESANFSQFLLDRFDLLMNNDPTQCTTRIHTTIDAVFSRFLENLKSKTYISYFSYHRPIVSMWTIDENNENVENNLPNDIVENDENNEN